MSLTFADFMRNQPFSRILREDEAAPPSGVEPPVPGNPDSTSNKDHFAAMKQQLGIDNTSFRAALEGGVISVYQPQDYSRKWGYEVTGPITATVEKLPAGNYSITFQLTEKKQMEPFSFIYPYNDGDKPLYYDGPVEDKTETISSEELQNIMAEPFKQGGAPAGGMGGMPMGGGAPPMGGI